ncbi:hypothetical protein HK104_005774, partial [Borealophlyctis nickersoniae]
MFRHLIAIRKLVDEASELVIKAAGGGSSSSPLGLSGGMGGHGSGADRNRVSHVRQNRLRELAVAKLARAYRIDEVATSVLTMQSASALDDVAAKILKRSPNNVDALYVHHFHEKIPSRMLAGSTTTETLDTIITMFPAVPEYYRTRAMIHCFREEFALSLKDFKIAVALTKKRKRTVNGVDCEALIHGGPASSKVPSLNIPPEDDDAGCESQLYLLRAACFHHYALSIIDKAIQKVNMESAPEKQKRKKKKKKKGGNGGAAAVAAETKDSPKDEPSRKPLTPTPEQYAAVIGPLGGQIATLARRSIRDYVRFLTYFPNTLPPFHHPVVTPSVPSTPSSSPPLSPMLTPKNGSESTSNAVATLPDFLLSIPSKSLVVSPTSPTVPPSTALTLGTNPDDPDSTASLPPLPPTSGTYHPLLVEAWYAIGLNYLLLGDWRTTAQWHERISEYQETVDGYPVFLPARSMSQADYVEVLRLMRRALVEKARNDVLEKMRQQKDHARKQAVGEDACADAPGDKDVFGLAKGRDQSGTTDSMNSAAETGGEVVKSNGGAGPSKGSKPKLSVSTTASPVESGRSTPTGTTTGTGGATGATGTPSSSASSLRPYPLHTKRADTVMIYLQAMTSLSLTASPSSSSDAPARPSDATLVSHNTPGGDVTSGKGRFAKGGQGTTLPLTIPVLDLDDDSSCASSPRSRVPSGGSDTLGEAVGRVVEQK